MEMGRGLKGQGDGRQVSSSLSILFVCVPLLYSHYTSFVCLSILFADRGSLIITTDKRRQESKYGRREAGGAPGTG